MAGAESAGDPIAVLPVLFHLLWVTSSGRPVGAACTSTPVRVEPAVDDADPAAVLRPGDWVTFDGGEHQVLALAGTSVRLRSTDGRETVVLVAYLMAAPEFAVIDAAPSPPVEPFGLLDALPVEVRDAAREWERHVVEVETGSAARRRRGTHSPAGVRPGEHDTASARPEPRPPSLGSACGPCRPDAPATRSRVCGVWSISAPCE